MWGLFQVSTSPPRPRSADTSLRIRTSRPPPPRNGPPRVHAGREGPLQARPRDGPALAGAVSGGFGSLSFHGNVRGGGGDKIFIHFSPK